MKKFTKGCLAAALVTFMIGIVLFGVGALFGGLRQLEHINVWNRTGIPFGFFRNGNQISFGFFDWDDDWREYWDWDSKEWKELERMETEALAAVEELEDLEDYEAFEEFEDHEEFEDYEEVEQFDDLEDQADDTADNGSAGDHANRKSTGLTADSIRNMELEVGACKMYIKETDSREVSIAIEGECEDHYRYRIKDGNTLLLVHKDMSYDALDTIWQRSHPRGNTKLYLYLPKTAVFDEITIDFGAGKLDAGYLKAREIEINAGAGKCSFEGLEASETIELTMGAGMISTGSLTAAEAKLDIAAGELTIDDAKVSRKTEATVSMGNADLKGTFAGELEVECSMGNLKFTLEGAEQDYNYDIESGLGSVRIGDKRYNDLADDHRINNGGSTMVDISCSMGSVEVDFTK